MRITKEMLESAKTPNGGYTKKQQKLGESWYPKKWKRNLTGSDIPKEDWEKFISYGRRSKKQALDKYKKDKNKVINSVSIKTDWAWKPQKSDIPEIKKKGRNNKNQGKNKAKRTKVVQLNDKDFYFSREWRALRVRVLEKYSCECMMCGRSPQIHGVVIHVDHIKPKSKYPELALTFTNLQLLCEDCNLGKSNKYQTDWRPMKEEELEILFEAVKFI